MCTCVNTYYYNFRNRTLPSITRPEVVWGYVKYYGMITKTVKNNRKKTFTVGTTSILEAVYNDDEINDIIPLPSGTR